MEIDIIFFDDNMDKDNLNKLLRFDYEILEYKPCYTSELKLYYSERTYFPVLHKDIGVSKREIAYGSYYKLRLSDLDMDILEGYYLSTDLFVKGKVKATTFTFNTINDYLSFKFTPDITINDCLCFVVNKQSAKFKSLKDNRGWKCNLNKRFFVCSY